MTDVILGMGEVGSTIFDLIESRGYEATGIDINPARNRNYTPDVPISDPEILHVCILGDMNGFVDTVLEAGSEYTGIRAILVHSTVRPGTARKLQEKTSVPIVSAPARGVHKRFLEDMIRYTKFLASDVDLGSELKRDLESRFKKVRWISDTITLEFSKVLVDTTYYGWLINYAQLTKMICDKHGMDYDELWTFGEEIQEVLGNRPKMYPGVIGGHCVIPNLSLIDHPALQRINEINEEFRAATESG